MKQLMLILFSAYCLYLCTSSATVISSAHFDPYSLIKEAMPVLRDGDLVVRLNRDPTSQFIKNFNRHDKSFSHTGTVFFENGRPYVFHMISGGENPNGKMKKDLLEGFYNPRRNTAFGIFRYDMDTCEIKKFKRIIYKWYGQGLRFDSAFNLQSDDKMYCAEMISKALSQATNKRISIEATQLTKKEVKLFSMYSHLSFCDSSKIQIIAVDNLYTNQHCRLIKKFEW